MQRAKRAEEQQNNKVRYEVDIQLKNPCGAEMVEYLPYYNSGPRRDAVLFEKRRILIEADRKRRITEDDVFMNLQHSLYNQLVKVLLIHYCHAGRKAGILRVSVRQKKSDGRGQRAEVKYEELFSRNFTDANQPFCAFDAPIPFDVGALKGVLDETDDAYRLRIVLLHWLSQGKYTDRQRRMEIVWRTFERLCEYHQHAPMGSRFKVADGLDSLLNVVLTNAASYPHSAATVAGKTLDTLRELRWQEMIENNYPKTNGNNLIRNYRNYVATLITPFFDERAVQLMTDILPYRRSELQRYGLYNNAVTDLQAKLALHQRRDIDLVALLCHYIYFLRNRLFHGQMLLRVSVFDVLNADNMRLDFLTGMLATLSVELVNNRSAL